ncbi:DEAD/DEAH box helicase [Pseudoalteromonas lipolytica]|uniref:DEAD/DEAH box helicase n=1 Tax=Pseudoalteromonas lipolytica TaxID=570156 RepID=UPI0030A5BB95
MNSQLDIDEVHCKLIKASVLMQLPNVFDVRDKVDLSKNEVTALVSYSSILSSGKGYEVNKSYEIITKLLEYDSQNTMIKSAAEVILSRIGNFPGRKLLEIRYGLNNKISVPLRLEVIARESENTIYFDNQEIHLTDFQLLLFNSLKEEKNLSISAPTSAGKSFVLNLSLSQQIKDSNGKCIVYVVPTRALISEVSTRVREAIKKIGSDKAIIRTAPFPVDRNKIKSNIVYIFTQERLFSFLGAKDVLPHIDTLIVDEAHEIQKGKRGIILQASIDLALKKFKDIKLLFASPLINNPEYFLSLFKRTSDGKYFTEVVSPVGQNILLVNQVKSKPKCLSIKLVDEQKVTDIGEFDIPFKLRSRIADQIGNFVLSLASEDSAVISYSNTPASAEERAIAASKLAPEIKLSPELETFIHFVSSEIHPEYSLLECLKKGIAFHYGNMPSLLRSGVEDLYKRGDIKAIFCTSTLLQGVNLPAKHIVIESPKSGSEPMSRSDFLNLAGRSGRLLHEFHGNVWCIRPVDWANECFKGDKLQSISSAIDNMMVDGGVQIQQAFSQSSKDVNDEKKYDEANVALGKLYNDYLDSRDSSFIESYRSDTNSDSIDFTKQLIESIAITLPSDIVKNNQSIRPDYLENLHLYLQAQDSLEDFYPIHPYTAGSKRRVEKIIKILIDCFDWKIHENYITWLSYLSYQWVWGKPIGKILGDRIKHLADKKGEANVKPSTEIRKCLKSLETDVRFKMVKYFSAYIEILRYVSERKNLPSREHIDGYHIYLEFGSCKKSVLNLMSVGLSRFTALHLDKVFYFDEQDEPESYIIQLRKVDLMNLKIPKLCINEVINFI